jgi:hypothetical protein
MTTVAGQSNPDKSPLTILSGRPGVRLVRAELPHLAIISQLPSTSRSRFGH